MNERRQLDRLMIDIDIDRSPDVQRKRTSCVHVTKLQYLQPNVQEGCGLFQLYCCKKSTLTCLSLPQARAVHFTSFWAGSCRGAAAAEGSSSGSRGTR